MNHVLINSCYENAFGIELKRYHLKICSLSFTELYLVEELNNSSRIIFEDGVSSSFQLQLHNNLLYLVGDKTCYPCSNVVKSAYSSMLNWVQCIVLPGQLKVTGETDIRKSGVIVSLFSDLIPEIPDEKRFFNFINLLEDTFSHCEWYRRIFSIALYVRLVNFWDYKQKITKLYELGLLYPLEFAIYTTYKHIEIKNVRILRYFVDSLSESTNKIFLFQEINTVLESLSESEIEDVFAIKEVVQNVRLHLINDEYFADLLEIDAFKRYPTFVNDKYYLYHMQDRAQSIFKTQSFKKEYLNLLKKNFRSLENKIRKSKGYEAVGSYFMEKLLYDRLRTAFPELTLLTQYSPEWLRPQRLDIFILECNLAIEYHGAQHYLPIDFFGGVKALELRRKLDQKKKKKCNENALYFVEISYEEDFDFAFRNLCNFIIELI